MASDLKTFELNCAGAFKTYCENSGKITGFSTKHNFYCPFHDENRENPPGACFGGSPPAIYCFNTKAHKSGAAQTKAIGKTAAAFGFIQTIMLLENLPFKQAVERCAELAGIPSPLSSGAHYAPKSPYAKKIAKIRKARAESKAAAWRQGL